MNDLAWTSGMVLAAAGVTVDRPPSRSLPLDPGPSSTSHSPSSEEHDG